MVGTRMFQRRTLSGEPVVVGGMTVTPQSQAVALRWPGGGWVWNRPVAVLVEQDGVTRRIPIVDVTRLAQLAFLGVGLGVWILALARFVRERRQGNG
jgi:hypothetical protein